MNLRWEPALRMTPDEAMKHAWIQEPKIQRANQKIQTSRKMSDGSLSTPEKKKENIRKHVLHGEGSAFISVFGISLCLIQCLKQGEVIVHSV